MSRLKYCFRDWVFWVTEDVFDPEEARRMGVSCVSNGRIVQGFWSSVNSGMFEMIDEFHDW